MAKHALRLLFLCYCLHLMLIHPSLSKPATFLQDFRVTWADSHIKQMENGTEIQLLLDQSSGAKPPPAIENFYLNSDTNEVRDELDFEFLGNRSGQPYTIQTNVYSHGKGDREQRVNLWFDPSAAYHTYSIFWNRQHIV
ncbi:Catalyzes xyloglucan endohydrolysis (XEH) and or endotransglycosylation (XET) [Asimina triloba]